MKKYLKYIVFSIALLGLNGCDSSFLDLHDPDAFEVQKFYKTEQDMEDALTATYSATRSFYNQMFFVTECKSDNTSSTLNTASSGLYASFTDHTVAPTNSIVENIWNGLNFTIYRSNLVLKYIDDESIKMSAENRARIKSEAKFLRALAHFYLVRLWGPVPIVDRILETDAEAKSLKRRPVEEVYSFIVGDLKEVAACESLSVFEGGERMGHATRTAGAALLGKVYVTMAAVLGNNDYYSEAVTYLTQACTLNSMTELPTTFANVFGTNHEDNAELIFQCMYFPAAGEYSSFAQNFQPLNQKGLTSNVTGTGYLNGDENLWNDFESTSPVNGRRKDVMAKAGSTYYCKKYVDKSNETGYGGNNWIELRFADVFLLLAEAYEQLGDDTNAIKYLDLVRTKHGNLKGYEETVTSSPAFAAKYPTLRAAIFHERREELCFENQRWFDLLRLYPNPEDLEAYMNSINANSLKFTGFRAYESLLPIPYDENFINKNLYQNDGY